MPPAADAFAAPRDFGQCVLFTDDPVVVAAEAGAGEDGAADPGYAWGTN